MPTGVATTAEGRTEGSDGSKGRALAKHTPGKKHWRELHKPERHKPNRKQRAKLRLLKAAGGTRPTKQQLPSGESDCSTHARVEMKHEKRPLLQAGSPGKGPAKRARHLESASKKPRPPASGPMSSENADEVATSRHNMAVDSKAPIPTAAIAKAVLRKKKQMPQDSDPGARDVQSGPASAGKKNSAIFRGGPSSRASTGSSEAASGGGGLAKLKQLLQAKVKEQTEKVVKGKGKVKDSFIRDTKLPENALPDGARRDQMLASSSVGSSSSADGDRGVEGSGEGAHNPPQVVSSNWEALASQLAQEKKEVKKKRKLQDAGRSGAGPDRTHLRKNEPGYLFPDESQLAHFEAPLAMDCEMVGVGDDGKRSVLARVSIVDVHGNAVMDTFVASREKVTDYRTHVSGIRVQNLKGAPQFAKVQTAVSKLTKDKVIVGHALQNDLAALMLSHPKPLIRDTAKYRPYQTGNKKARKLRDLSAEVPTLSRQSQCSHVRNPFTSPAENCTFASMRRCLPLNACAARSLGSRSRAANTHRSRMRDVRFSSIRYSRPHRKLKSSDASLLTPITFLPCSTLLLHGRRSWVQRLQKLQGSRARRLPHLRNDKLFQRLL